MAGRPFLTIVTRCCERPRMLSINIASVKAQTDRDIEQIFIPDFKRVGIYEANLSLERNEDRIDGEFVYILDDDCKLLDDTFVSKVRAFAREYHLADIVMVKSYRPQLAPKILPPPKAWRKPANLRMKVNCLCYVVRNDMWKASVHEFGRKAAGAWGIMAQMLENKARLGWLDIVAAGTQQLGRGRLFENCDGNWWSKTVERHGIEKVGEDDWRLRLWRKKKR